MFYTEPWKNLFKKKVFSGDKKGLKIYADSPVKARGRVKLGENLITVKGIRLVYEYMLGMYEFPGPF